MLSASATLLSTTPGPLSSTALVPQRLRQIRAAGLDRGPAPRHIVNAGPGRIAAHQSDPGGLGAVRENAMRFWRQQEDPLSLLGSAPTPKPLPAVRKRAAAARAGVRAGADGPVERPRAACPTPSGRCDPEAP